MHELAAEQKFCPECGRPGSAETDVSDTHAVGTSPTGSGETCAGGSETGSQGSHNLPAVPAKAAASQMADTRRSGGRFAPVHFHRQREKSIRN